MIGIVLAPAVLYSAQLYFNTWHCVALLVSIALILLNRPALGFLTLLKLILPLSRIILRLALELRLFFGPVHSFLANRGAILVHLLCIIGLYVDEKLLIIKVLLLPLYRTLVDLFDWQRSSPFGTARIRQTSHNSFLHYQNSHRQKTVCSWTS